MIDDRKKSDEDPPQDGNEELRGQGFEIIPEEELAEGTTRATFFGEARYVPEAGERVEVRAPRTANPP